MFLVVRKYYARIALILVVLALSNELHQLCKLTLEDSYKKKLYPILKQVEEAVARNETEDATRCQRYGFNYYNQTKLNIFRRIFVGSLIADDSWNPIDAVAAEGYDIYHTVVFIESNTAIDGSRRKMRFLPNSTNLKRLTNGTLYGRRTKVHVDYWSRPEITSQEPWAVHHGLLEENMQRDWIINRWKMNGMRPDDIGIIQDTDETFTRDFLVAAQTCDIEEFRPGQNCKDPKLIGDTMVFESSPSCIKRRNWYHPDMIIGECIELIGNNTRHPIIKRGAMEGASGCRPNGHIRGNYSQILYPRKSTKTMYPLWNAWDFRMAEGGRQVKDKEKFHTGFHFHNFFDDIKTMRNKYGTYGHANKGAYTISLEDLCKDVKMSIECVLDINNTDGGSYLPGGLSTVVGEIPVYFTKSYIQQRHEYYHQMIINTTNLFTRKAKKVLRKEAGKGSRKAM